jgi:CDGSH-type Zn-finger protein
MENQQTQEEVSFTECEVLSKGPLRVKGMLQVKMPDGTVVEKGPTTHFCRCGASANKPFCDGKHKTFDFETENSAQ